MALSKYITNTALNTDEVAAQELAEMGHGALSYIREICGRDVNEMIGGGSQVAPDARLYCLYNAKGSPISVSGTREAAAESAADHDLAEATLH